MWWGCTKTRKWRRGKGQSMKLANKSVGHFVSVQPLLHHLSWKVGLTHWATRGSVDWHDRWRSCRTSCDTSASRDRLASSFQMVWDKMQPRWEGDRTCLHLWLLPCDDPRTGFSTSLTPSLDVWLNSISSSCLCQRLLAKVQTRGYVVSVGLIYSWQVRVFVVDQGKPLKLWDGVLQFPFQTFGKFESKRVRERKRQWQRKDGRY